MSDQVQVDPVYDARNIPAYLAKIGALTVRNEMLASENIALREALNAQTPEPDPADEE